MAKDLLTFIFGALFGFVIQYANLNKYNVISGQAQLKDNTVLKTILLTIGVGAILLSIIIQLGLASFHVKPFLLGGVIIGGLLFGIGMAILGYCPGTMAVSLGEGSLDALVGIIGGLLGGYVFTILLPYLQGIIGKNLGKISVFTLVSGDKFLYFLLVFVIGLFLIWAAFFISKDKFKSNKKWIVSGISLAVLNAIVFLKFTTNRPIGASTSYPYLADLILGATHNSYFHKIATPGRWEVIFLLGAVIAAFVGSVLKKDFKLKLIYSNWAKYKGNSSLKRIIWAFVGGFILIFGARLAGGCTSGHIISGGMQLAISSFVFAIFVFVGLIITGKLFYRD